MAKKGQSFFALDGLANQPRTFLQHWARISVVTKKRQRAELLNAKTPPVLEEFFLENIPGGLVKNRKVQKNC